MAKTNISWCDDTWNPIVGCSIKSTGCKNCYAMRAAWRMSHNPKTPQYHGTATLVNRKPVWTGKMSFAEKAFLKPLKTRKPTRFFVNSMGDLFHEDVPEKWIDRVFAVMALCSQHIFQVLTKRPDRMREYVSTFKPWRDPHGLVLVRPAPGVAEEAQGPTEPCYVTRGGVAPNERPKGSPLFHLNGGGAWPLPNVHLGVSVEDQTTADDRIPLLLDTPAAVRWISAEPLLGPVDVLPYLFVYTHDDIAALECGCSDKPLPFHQNPKQHDVAVQKLDLVITGGESGPGARPMHPDWARSLRDQCQAAGVPFHFKQWGAWGPGSDLNYDKNTLCMDRSGRTVKAPAGRNDFPEKSSSSDGWVWMRKHGKKRAGRRLDGKTHDGQVA